VVVWRGQDGKVHAWEDWCPHRGMRLSFGFARGKSLRPVTEAVKALLGVLGTGERLTIAGVKRLTSAPGTVTPRAPDGPFPRSPDTCDFPYCLIADTPLR
jgi:Rieske [2Fe-2S] domain